MIAVEPFSISFYTSWHGARLLSVYAECQRRKRCLNFHLFAGYGLGKCFIVDYWAATSVHSRKINFYFRRFIGKFAFFFGFRVVIIRHLLDRNHLVGPAKCAKPYILDRRVNLLVVFEHPDPNAPLLLHRRVGIVGRVHLSPGLHVGVAEHVVRVIAFGRVFSGRRIVPAPNVVAVRLRHEVGVVGELGDRVCIGVSDECPSRALEVAVGEVACRSAADQPGVDVRLVIHALDRNQSGSVCVRLVHRNVAVIEDVLDLGRRETDLNADLAVVFFDTPSDAV